MTLFHSQTRRHMIKDFLLQAIPNPGHVIEGIFMHLDLSYTRPKNKRSILGLKTLHVKWELQNFICYLCFATIPATHYSHCFLSSVNPIRCTVRFVMFQIFTCKLILFRFTHVLSTEICSQISNVKCLKLKITHCKFTMPRWTPVERDRAIWMLQAKVTPSIITQQFQCLSRTIARLRKRFWRDWDTVRSCVFRTQLCNDATSRSIKP